MGGRPPPADALAVTRQDSAPLRLLVALLRIMRVVGVVAGLFATWSLLKRLPLDPSQHNALVMLGSAGLLAAVWTFRRPYMPWATLLAGTNVYSYLWFWGDRTGLGPHFDYVLGLDRLVGLGQVPTVWLQQQFHSPGVTAPQDILFTVVYLSFFVAPYLTLVTLWFHARPKAAPFARAFVGALFAGLVLIIAVPTAPPWMAAEAGLIPPVSRVAHEFIAGVNSSVYQETYEFAGVNDIAAMPSIHVAVTFVVAVALARSGRRGARAAGIAYVAAMGVALVYLGEHYVADVVAGVATGWVGWRISDHLGRRTSEGARGVLAESAVEAEPLAEAA
ncbi:MAG: phosphatase PAP2 family protein [Dehalococcoidia bacterium]|nr:phosphatase PAP2 family protein [Dehalococcoidia bacterium]